MKTDRLPAVVRPPGGGSYLYDDATGTYTPVFLPQLSPQPAYEEPDPVDPDAVEVALPEGGGSYVLHPGASEYVALFVPETGMSPDFELPEVVVEDVIPQQEPRLADGTEPAAAPSLERKEPLEFLPADGQDAEPARD